MEVGLYGNLREYKFVIVRKSHFLNIDFQALNDLEAK